MKIKIANIEKFLLMLVISSLFFENVSVFYLFGGAIKLSQIAMIFSIVYGFLFHKHKAKEYLGMLFFLIFPLMPLYRINDIAEFLKSYMNYAIMVFFVCFALKGMRRVFCKDVSFYLKFFNIVVSIAAILAIIQFILMNLFGIFWLDGLWGDFQFHPSSYGMQIGFYRAYSVFHEPSYLGFICNIAIAINLVVPNSFYKDYKIRIRLLILYTISVLCTISTSAILIMAGLFIVYFLFSLKSDIRIIKRKTFAIIIFIVFFVIMFLVCVELFNISIPIVDMLYERLFNETGNEGTSAYERIKTPLEYIRKTFENYPLFGRGIGQEGDIDAVKTIGLYAGVNNSIFGIIVNFGLSSMVFFICFINEFFSRKFKGKYLRQRAILFLSLIGMYLSTGAYISGDTFILTIITLLFLAIFSSDNDNIERLIGLI